MPPETPASTKRTPCSLRLVVAALIESRKFELPPSTIDVAVLEQPEQLAGTCSR